MENGIITLNNLVSPLHTYIAMHNTLYACDVCSLQIIALEINSDKVEDTNAGNDDSLVNHETVRK